MPELLERGFAFSTTNVAVATTNETVVITSPVVVLPFKTHHLLIQAWCQLTVGTGTTAITARIRRGTTTADPLVGEANAEAVKGAVGSTEPVLIIVAEDLDNVNAAQYVFTVQQTGATADGTVLQAAITVDVL